MPVPELESLVYVSSAARPFGLIDIAHLLKRARTRNLEHGITGLLLYTGGNFMQCIEGSPRSVDTIFRIVEDDPGHSGIIQISRERIARRDFNDWSMGFLTRDFQGHVGAPGETDLVRKVLEQPDHPASDACVLLQGFWNQGHAQSTR